MKISHLFQTKKPVVSFEIFPPKPDSPFEPIIDTIKELATLKPDFISVTYGAAGSNRGRTIDIAEHIKDTGYIESLAHLTSIVDSPEEIDEILKDMKNRGIENILALRGDPPKDSTVAPRNTYAKDLVTQIKNMGGFCIGGAAYPEGHPECPDKKQELIYLKEKIDAGVDFLITQIFFDNKFFYDFREKLNALNIDTPICAGIMPVFSRKQIEHICSLCGTQIPPVLRDLLNKYGDNQADMQKAGLEYASKQIRDLIENDVNGVHLYTMNKPELAKAMVKDNNLR